LLKKQRKRVFIEAQKEAQKGLQKEGPKRGSKTARKRAKNEGFSKKGSKTGLVRGKAQKRCFGGDYARFWRDPPKNPISKGEIVTDIKSC